MFTVENYFMYVMFDLFSLLNVTSSQVASLLNINVTVLLRVTLVSVTRNTYVTFKLIYNVLCDVVTFASLR